MSIKRRADGWRFDLWLRKVDRLMMGLYGIESTDLPDWPYELAWRSGRSALSVVREVCANAQRRNWHVGRRTIKAKQVA